MENNNRQAPDDQAGDERRRDAVRPGDTAENAIVLSSDDSFEELDLSDEEATSSTSLSSSSSSSSSNSSNRRSLENVVYSPATTTESSQESNKNSSNLSTDSSTISLADTTYSAATPGSSSHSEGSLSKLKFVAVKPVVAQSSAGIPEKALGKADGSHFPEEFTKTTSTMIKGKPTMKKARFVASPCKESGKSSSLTFVPKTPTGHTSSGDVSFELPAAQDYANESFDSSYCPRTPTGQPSQSEELLVLFESSGAVTTDVEATDEGSSTEQKQDPEKALGKADGAHYAEKSTKTTSTSIEGEPTMKRARFVASPCKESGNSSSLTFVPKTPTGHTSSGDVSFELPAAQDYANESFDSSYRPKTPTGQPSQSDELLVLYEASGAVPTDVEQSDEGSSAETKQDPEKQPEDDKEAIEGNSENKTPEEEEN